MNRVVKKQVGLTQAQRRAEYRPLGKRHGKWVFAIPAKKVLSSKSAFEHKLLCDGDTLSLGLTCGFSCAFCYVPSSLARNPFILRILKETGLCYRDFVVEKSDAVEALRRQLLDRRGAAKFDDPADTRVVFASPLVDVAANVATTRETIKACRLILEHTSWQVRLLSKSALLRMVAEKLAEYRDRLIFGLSTGTLEDRLAAAFEIRASSPSTRLLTLHWLQDNGFRTYGMLCPSLPQEDYGAFARAAAEAIRVDRCEHVWAEVMNVRGNSLTRTCASLTEKGFGTETEKLMNVSGAKNRQRWEEYARATFLAHTSVVPPEKLRFLQYVRPETSEWWNDRRSLGAVPLGRHALVQNGRQAIGPPGLI